MIRTLCTALSCLAASALPALPASAGTPPLRLVVASKAVVVDRYQSDPGIMLNLGAYIAANETFELRVKRSSYAREPEVHRRIGGRDEKLPAGLVKDFSGLPKFLAVRIKDSRGRTVKRLERTFCPAGPSSRVERDAAPLNRYPEGCSAHVFTLGSVWGVQKGWAVNTASYDAPPVDLKPGAYSVELNVTKKYQRLFGISGRTHKLRLTVRGIKEEARLRTGDGPRAERPGRRPSGAPAVPDGPKPNLRALPPFEIAITKQDDMGNHDRKHDYLRFSSTVWNAGPSRLVVDGFRRAGEDVMEAYQYFYDASGEQTGYTKTGAFAWDPKRGHEHWHFKDFASYRLLSEGRKRVVRGQKEAFCLANTDQIDLTVEGANWRPDGTSLATSCGERTSLSVRQVLETGSGDTYGQSLPGQSFDITRLPNGVYHLEVRANPSRRLVESTLADNAAYRKITLGGRPGRRTVKVAAVGLIKSP